MQELRDMYPSLPTETIALMHFLETQRHNGKVYYELIKALIVHIQTLPAGAVLVFVPGW